MAVLVDHNEYLLIITQPSSTNNPRPIQWVVHLFSPRKPLVELRAVRHGNLGRALVLGPVA